MKKKMAAWILTGIMAAGMLAGCGSSSGSSKTESNDAAKESGTEEKSEKGYYSDTTSTELNLFTWAGMFPQEVLDQFTEETGIKINYANFDYDEDMLAKLETAKGGDYDVVIADDYIIQIAIEEGLVQKLDLSKILNWKCINPAYQGQYYDPQDEYTVPYGAGVQTIVYDPDLVEKEIAGYADLWDAALESNIAITGNYRVIEGMALKTFGYSYNTEDTKEIETAGEKLKELAPNIRLISDNDTQNFIITGEASVGILYTSQVTTALLERPDLKVVYPKEGIGFGIMANFIPSNAPHADAAYAFIDYILQPEVSAACYEYMGYYCTNKDAESYISDKMKDAIIMPDGLENMEMIRPVSADADEIYYRIWTEFKDAVE